MQEGAVDAGADVAELGDHRVLGHVNGHLGRKDDRTALQQRHVGSGGAGVVHLLNHHKEQRQSQVEALRDVLARQREELARIKALEDGTCAGALKVFMRDVNAAARTRT